MCNEHGINFTLNEETEINSLSLEFLERVSLLKLCGKLQINEISDFEFLSRLNPRKITISSLMYVQSTILLEPPIEMQQKFEPPPVVAKNQDDDDYYGEYYDEEVVVDIEQKQKEAEIKA